MQHSALPKLLLLATAFSELVRAQSFEECAAHDPGTFVAIANNCMAYIFCNDELSYTDLCPADTYFDEARQQCSIDENFKCYSDVALAAAALNRGEDSAELAVVDTTVATAATTAISSSTTLLPQSTTQAINVLERPKCQSNANEYFAYARRCEYFYRCYHGYLSILRCSFGMGWDHELSLCVPMEQAKCFGSTDLRAQ